MEKQIPETPSNEHRETNIDGDVSGSVIISGNGNVVNVGGEKPSKRPRRKAKPKLQKVNWSNPAIIAAVIGAVATIIAALLASPLVEKWVEPTPTPTETASATPTESPTAAVYVSPTPIILVVTSTEQTPTASATFTPTSTPADTVTPSFTPTPKASTMTALLQSTVDDGKAPLMVNFDARSSYIKFADGSMMPCGNNPFCSYSFAIYHDSKFADRVNNNTGVLSYTFDTKGKYFVTVYACRGEACNDDGVTVTVR